jgi:hypothetical protein
MENNHTFVNVELINGYPYVPSGLARIRQRMPKSLAAQIQSNSLPVMYGFSRATTRSEPFMLRSVPFLSPGPVEAFEATLSPNLSKSEVIVNVAKALFPS